MNEQNRRGWVRYVIDFSSPLSLLVTYFFFGRDFMLATGVSVVVAIVALAFGFIAERRLAWLPLIVGVLGIIFGGLTLIFQADWILKLRPTFVNYAFAIIFFGGLILKKNPIKAVGGGSLRHLLSGRRHREPGRLADPDRGDLGDLGHHRHPRAQRRLRAHADAAADEVHEQSRGAAAAQQGRGLRPNTSGT